MSASWDTDFFEILDVPFDFTRQPDPIPATLRPERRVPLALLLVAKSRGSGASWKALQLLNWAVRDPNNMDLLVALRNSQDMPERPLVRLDPALDRALDLAVGLELLEQKSSRVFQLTASGRRVVEDLNKTEIFIRERELLALLPGKLTQKEVQRVLEWRTA
ncbi:hypothetical protein ACFFWE_17075 [Sphaerisporangium melleum]|nr:hypothetical protein [Sphaerisporangium melleum]